MEVYSYEQQNKTSMEDNNIYCGSVDSMPTSKGNAKQNLLLTIWIITTLTKPYNTHNTRKQHSQSQISQI